MKIGKRTLFLLLASILLLSAVSCSKSEEKTTETPGETAQAALSDEEAIAQYLQKIRGGDFDSEKLFDYEDLTQYFALGEYRGLTYPADTYIDTEVSDEYVNRYFNVILLKNFATESDYQSFTEGSVQLYDTAIIDYAGYVDGVKIEKACDEDMNLVIGSNTFIPGFEDGLIGKAVGETVPLTISVSPYYSAEEISGKDVLFQVTIKSIKRSAIPEVTLEKFNETYSSSYESMDAIKAAMKKDLESDKSSKAYDYIVQYLTKKVIAGSTVAEALPEKEMQHYVDYFMKYYEDYAAYSKVELEKLVTETMGITMEALNAEAKEFAKDSVLADLMVYSICEKEGISYTDEDVTTLINSCYSSSKNFTNVESMLSYYEQTYGAFYFIDNVLWSNVCHILYNSAVKA